MSEIRNKTVSIKEVYDAIAVDGYDHLRDDWITFKSFDGQIRPLGACLVGMAAVNLSVIPDSGWASDNAKGKLSQIVNPDDNDGPWEYNESLRDYVRVGLTDAEQTVAVVGLADQLDRFHVYEPIPQYLKDVGYAHGTTLGSALVTLNDSRVPGDNSKYRYSFKELIDMARELMSPFFDERIEVTQIDLTDASIIRV